MSNSMEATNVDHLQEQTSSNLKVGMVAELYHAALNGSFQDVCDISNWMQQVTPTRNNVLHLHVGKPSHEKAKDGTTKGVVNVEFIRNILNCDDQLLWKANNKGDTPLHLAARFGHHKAVEQLLVCATQLNQAVALRLLRLINNNKDTALHNAARAGHAEVVELLVRGDPDGWHEPNEEGETPLYLAAERGCTATVFSIIENCNTLALDYTCKGPCGRTALHAAVLWGHPRMVLKILEIDSRLVRVQDNEGLTPLHCTAMEIDKFQTLKELLKYVNNYDHDESSAVYIQDNKGRTILHIAVLFCNWVALSIIIASCPDCIEITDNNGQNVVHYIAKTACVFRVGNFLRLGHFDSLLNEKDVQGNTPLHILAASILTDIADPDHRSICLHWFSTFIREIPLMDKKAFNRQNFTFADIISTCKGPPFPLQSIVSKEVPPGKRIYHNFKKDVNVDKAILEFDDLRKEKLKTLTGVGKNHLVVAALISTISFTSALTLPGGFNQNTGKDIGMAVLTSKGAFIAFLVFDILAFTCSTIAILFYFFLANTISAWMSLQLLRGGYLLTTWSLGAMGIALTTGVCAVVSHSLTLVIVVVSISAVFFIFYIPIALSKSLQDALRWMIGCRLVHRSILLKRRAKSKCDSNSSLNCL